MKKIITLVAVLALVAVASPALANGGHHRSSGTDIDVDVDNSAYVKNVDDTTASTGGNDSSGGSARNYVRGGSVNNTTANGGSTGDIDTGDATATTLITNTVNSTTAISSCVVYT